MKKEKNSKGFTLLELLVVVLIISILAAIALPQYKMAVAKAHISRLLLLIKRIENSQQIYYIQNNSFTGNFSVLDIDWPSDVSISLTKVNGEYFSCERGYNNGRNDSIYCRDKKYSLSLEKYYNRQITWCWFHNETAKKICQNLCKVNNLTNTDGCRIPN